MSVRARGRALAYSIALALGVGLLAAGSGTARTPKDDDPTYDVLFEARLAPTERTAHVRIELGEGASNLHELRFSIDPERHVDFGGDGEVTLAADSVTWVPPTNGGELNYVFRIDHLRDQRSYDARCAATWALFRGDDLVPPVRSRFEDGAKSRSRLRFRLPKGWSAAVPYARLRGGDYRVRHRHRSFDRPTGWMVFGDIGVIREEVAGTRVAVAGPVRHGLRRLDLLALLRWTLPYLAEILQDAPERLLIVGAGAPMWRGGLSGPQSVYVHVDRPLITEDGTSPLLHEILHAAVGARADDEYDWIVEGLAEYYSIELLARSGTLSVERSEAALKKVGGVGDEKPTGVQHGRDTVRGVRFFHDLDQKIRAGSPDGSRSLDDVFRVLAAYRKKLTLEVVRQAVLEATGRSLADFGMDPAAEGQGG
jgi:hypothetical protein